MMFKIAQIDGEPVYYEATDYVDKVTMTKRTRHEFVKRKPDGVRVRIAFTVAPRVKAYDRKLPVFYMDERVTLSKTEIEHHFQRLVEVVKRA